MKRKVFDLNECSREYFCTKIQCKSEFSCCSFHLLHQLYHYNELILDYCQYFNRVKNADSLDNYFRSSSFLNSCSCFLPCHQPFQNMNNWVHFKVLPHNLCLYCEFLILMLSHLIENIQTLCCFNRINLHFLVNF